MMFLITGIASLLTGDLQEADVYLGLAARWAQTPIEELNTLSNLGSHHFFNSFDALLC